MVMCGSYDVWLAITNHKMSFGNIGQETTVCFFFKLQSLHKEFGEVVVAQLVDTSSRDLLHLTLYFAFFFSFLIFLFQSLFTFDWLVLVVWVKQHAITHVPSPQETFLVGRLILTSGSYRITFIGWVFSGLWTSLTMNCLVLLGAQRWASSRQISSL